MKKGITIMFLLLFSLASFVLAEQHDANLHVFYGHGCPHCAKMLQFLDSIKDNYPTLNIKLYEVYGNQTNQLLFIEYIQKCNSSIGGVPTVIIDKKVFVGFGNSLAESLEKEIQRCVAEGCEDINVSSEYGQQDQTTCEDDETEYIEADSDPINPNPEPYHSFVGWVFIIGVILIMGYVVIKKLTKR